MNETDTPPQTDAQTLEGKAGVYSALKDITKRILASVSIEHIAANIRGGGTTAYIIRIAPAKSGDVYVSLECEVTPMKRTLTVVKGLDNGRLTKGPACTNTDEPTPHPSEPCTRR